MEKKKLTKIILLIYFISIVLGLIFIIYLDFESKNPKNKEKTTSHNTVIKSVKTTYLFPQAVNKGIKDKDNIIRIDLSVNDSGFTPKQIVVPNNSIVMINLRVTEGFHNFIIKEYAIYTPHLTTNQTQVFSFFANKPGKFKFYSDTSKYEIKPKIEGIFFVR